jgi:hypothetical protein
VTIKISLLNIVAGLRSACKHLAHHAQKGNNLLTFTGAVRRIEIVRYRDYLSGVKWMTTFLFGVMVMTLIIGWLAWRQQNTVMRIVAGVLFALEVLLILFLVFVPIPNM